MGGHIRMQRPHSDPAVVSHLDAVHRMRLLLRFPPCEEEDAPYTRLLRLLKQDGWSSTHHFIVQLRYNPLFVDCSILLLNQYTDNGIMPSGGRIRFTGSAQPAHRVPPRQEVNTLVFTSTCHFGGIIRSSSPTRWW